MYLLETVTLDGVRPASEEEVTQRLGGLPDEQLLLCGHTHLQRSMRLRNGVLIVNPGSVGWPAYAASQPYPHVMEAGTPDAQLAIIDNETGSWEVAFQSTHYDIEQAAMSARAKNRPDLEHALRTGRMPRTAL